MAKNIEMKHLNGSGEYEPLYPKTLAGNTIISNATATEIGVSVGSTVDEALMNKENTLPIGTILPSIFDLGAKYLPIGTQGSKAKVDDYPELYELLNEEQLTSGWVRVDTYEYWQKCDRIDYIDGFYWIVGDGGLRLYYKKNLGESTWTSIKPPDYSWGSSNAHTLVKYVKDKWFFCGYGHSEKKGHDLLQIFYASSQEVINGEWHVLSKISCNTDDDYNGHPAWTGRYFFAEYINNCYVFGSHQKDDTPRKWCFHCYPSLEVNNTPEFIVFDSKSNDDLSFYPQLFGTNGYWYCYYFIDKSNKNMGIYGADSFNGLQKIAKIESTGFNWEIVQLEVTRLLENVGGKIFFEYDNQQYHFYTLTGTYSSKNPLGDFQYNSEQLIVNKNTEQVNNYYYVPDEGGLLYNKSCYGEFKKATIQSATTYQAKAFNYIDGIGYAILQDGVYINKNDLFDLPYAPSSYPLVYYIRAK